MITLANGLPSQLDLSLSRQVSLEHQILCRMSQSMAIMEYINDVRPEAALLPKDPKSRAKVCPYSLLWQNVVTKHYSAFCQLLLPIKMSDDFLTKKTGIKALNAFYLVCVAHCK
jgi:glutathione S-transferase